MLFIWGIWTHRPMKLDFSVQAHGPEPSWEETGETLAFISLQKRQGPSGLVMTFHASGHVHVYPPLSIHSGQPACLNVPGDSHDGASPQ